ncbi:MAG: conjugal transfer protein TraF [Acidobacteriota bacterium]|nr:conjugal transfer protein TraF [Acidobacteriota bacterium]
MRRFPLVLFLAALAAAPASAQNFESIGVRALGMAGAHVAVADDAAAIWWNPAGLASGALFTAAVERSQFDRRGPGLFGAGLPVERSAFFIGAGSLPIGLSYVRTRETSQTLGPADGPEARQLVTHQAGATVLQSLTDTIVVAATLKYVRGSAAAGAMEIGEGLDEAAGRLSGRGSHAFDADLGVMAVAGDLKAGLTVKNLFSPEFGAPDGTRLELPWMARAGVSYLASPAMTIAIDVDLRAVQQRRSLSFGTEYRFTRSAVRAGARFDTVGDVNPLGTVGASYAVRNGMWVDVWAGAGARGAERGWGLAGRIVY